MSRPVRRLPPAPKSVPRIPPNLRKEGDMGPHGWLHIAVLGCLVAAAAVAMIVGL